MCGFKLASTATRARGRGNNFGVIIGWEGGVGVWKIFQYDDTIIK